MLRVKELEPKPSGFKELRQLWESPDEGLCGSVIRHCAARIPKPGMYHPSEGTARFQETEFLLANSGHKVTGI